MSELATQPSASALEAVANAIEVEGSSDVFDGVDALVRTAIKNRQIILDPSQDLNEYVLDLVAEAYATTRDKAEDYNPDRRLTPWIIGIAGTLLLMRFRDDKRQRERDRDPSRFDIRLVADEVTLDDQIDPSDEDLFATLEHADVTEQVEARLEVEAILSKLEGNSSGNGGGNRQHAEILRRHYLEGETTEELATTYRVSVNAIHARLSRARRIARKVAGDQ